MSTVWSLIFDSPAGLVWIIRIATSIIIAGLAFLYFVLAKRAGFHKKKSSASSTSSAILLVILAVGGASIFSNSMLSHNSAVTFLPSIAVFADWLHFMAVSTWVGGLFYFSAVLFFSIKSEKEVERRAYHLSIILPRFSLLATASLGIIGVTGVYMAWIHLHTLDSLFATQYGNNLIIKLSARIANGSSWRIPSSKIARKYSFDGKHRIKKRFPTSLGYNQQHCQQCCYQVWQDSKDRIAHWYRGSIWQHLLSR